MYNLVYVKQKQRKTHNNFETYMRSPRLCLVTKKIVKENDFSHI